MCMLEGMRVIFLGSSVTFGYASDGVSFADFLAERNGCLAIKEAVSGTTLVDSGRSSYVARMKAMQVDGKVDLFVCQLSTNDATKHLPIGKVASGFDLADFDTQTVAGAIEYIIAYAKATYDCPVVFYTSPRYDSPAYQKMVDVMLEIVDKWGIGLIDLWNDEAFNAISEEERALYMADPIHPTREGYLKWWTPYFEERL